MAHYNEDKDLDRILRLTNIIQCYERLTEFLLSQSYVLNETTISEFGIDETINKLYDNITEDYLQRNDRNVMRTCEELKLSRSTFYVRRTRRKEELEGV